MTMRTWGLLRVPYKLVEVRGVAPATAEIPIAESDGAGRYQPASEQRHVLLMLEDEYSHPCSIGLTLPVARAVLERLTAALAALEELP